MSPTPAAPLPPSDPAPARSGWKRFTDELVRIFHAYGHWLAGISWLRFVMLSVLLLIVAGLLSALAASAPSRKVTIFEQGDGAIPTPPSPPAAPKAPAAARAKGPAAVVIEKQNSKGEDVTISIDGSGVRITPGRRGVAASDAAAAADDAATAADAAASAASKVSNLPSVEIKLPPGATSDAVREAIEEARSEVVEAIREAQRDADAAAVDARKARDRAARTVRRIEQHDDSEPPFAQLAMIFIIASAIMKITYAGQVKAETRAAVATETAESEQLKRQVAEARMAALQAQVEPHFLFNTLASIDHLIETDPKRASQMQKNLIALLRASMPNLRDAQPQAHNLGREMAVIRPYLEILKVRMEDRLQTRIEVPEGLLSAEFPSMMIQSLVENAIKHGLEPKAEGGELRVAAEIVHGKLAVMVADTGLGFGKAATAGTGVGLENIRERLKLLYGDKAAMVVTDNAPTGTVVTLTVPYQSQAV